MRPRPMRGPGEWGMVAQTYWGAAVGARRTVFQVNTRGAYCVRMHGG